MLFLDTEFAESVDRTVALLSIGLVSAHDEFYVQLSAEELAAIPACQLNDFVRAQVLPQFQTMPMASMRLADMAPALVAWLDGFGGSSVEVAYDYSVDFALLEHLIALAPTPPKLELVPIHVGYLNEDADGMEAASACFEALSAQRQLLRHHALADANALRAKFERVHGVGDSTPTPHQNQGDASSA